MKSGSISIYLSLVFAVLLSLLTVMIVGARDSVIRFKTECSMDAALYSVFAEYNRELLNQYDLLFIDTSYGNGQGSVSNLETHIKGYLNNNFVSEQTCLWDSNKDLLALSAIDVEIKDYSLATDEKGGIFKRQAIDFVKNKYGLNCMEKIKSNFDTAKDASLFTRDVSLEQKQNQAEIDGMELPKKKISEEEWEEIPLDNPADTVNSNRSIGILSFVLDDTKELSTQAVALSNYVSSRDCEEGSGLGERENVSNVENILFDRYILEKADCYTSEEKKGQLQYQIEYILGGKDNDMDNLQYVAEKLLFMRQAANVSYIFTDASKIAEAEALALSLTAVAIAPEFAEPVKLSILLAWAYAESVYDVKHLLAGGKIPLVKTSTSWHFTLSEMLQFGQHLSDEVTEETTESGLDYKEYLSLLLLTQSTDTKVYRMMDVIEMNIRQTNGNSKFRIDTCVDYLDAEAVIHSGYGYECTIERSYFYY